MIISNILEIVVDAKPLSKLLSLRKIGDGISGEIFETYVFNALEKSCNISHVGLEKSKADLIIDDVEYSCKVKCKKSKPTKVHHTGFDIRDIKRMNAKKIKELIYSTVSDINFMFLVQDGKDTFVSICNISKLLLDIKNNNFSVIINGSSATIDANGKRINITKSAVFLNNRCFTETSRKAFVYEDHCPYKIVKELLS